MTFAASSITTIDNCQFFKGNNGNVKPIVSAGYDSISYP